MLKNFFEKNIYIQKKRMQSIKSKIKNILDVTTSDEVKYICKSVLDISNSINENISNLNENNLIYLLNEKFKNVNLAIDEESRNFIRYIKILNALDNLGIKSYINEIENFENSNNNFLKYPSLKYTIDKIRNEVYSKGNNFNKSPKPEYVVINEVVSMIKPFTWDPFIKNMYNKLNENYNKYYDKIVLANALYTMKNSRNSFIFENMIENVENALIETSTKNLNIVLEDLKKFNYLAFVKNIENQIKEIKSKQSDTIDIISDNTSCNVLDIYAPMVESYGSDIFYIDKFFYQKNGDKIKLLKNKEQVTESFEQLCSIISSDNVKLLENKIVYYLKNDKFEILNENGNQYLVHKGNKYNRPDINKKLLELGSINIYNAYDSYNLQKLYEYYDTIKKLDFAKKIENKKNNKYYVILFETNNNFYIHKVNLIENNNEFYSNLSLVQAQKIIKDFLGFDIRKSFDKYMNENEKKIKKYENKKAEILNYIVTLENELKKVNETLENTYFKDEKSLIETKYLLETEINNKKELYSDIVNDIDALTNKDNDTGINVGDIVKIAGDDKLYTVISIDSFNNNAFLVSSDGISISADIDSVKKASVNVSKKNNNDNNQIEPIYNDNNIDLKKIKEEEEINVKNKTDQSKKTNDYSKKNNVFEFHVGNVVQMKGDEKLYTILSVNNIDNRAVIISNNGIPLTVNIDLLKKINSSKSNNYNNDKTFDTVYNDTNIKTIKEDNDTGQNVSISSPEMNFDTSSDNLGYANNNLSAYPSDDYVETSIGSMEPLDFSKKYIQAKISDDYKEIPLISGKPVRIDSEEFIKLGDEDFVTVYYEGNKFLIPKKFIIVSM